MIFRLAAGLAPGLGPQRAPRLFAEISRRSLLLHPSRRAVAGNLKSAGLPVTFLPQVMENFGRYLGEFLCLGGAPSERLAALESLCDEGDTAELRRVRSKGRAALLLSMHYGNWELGAHIFSRTFGDTHVIIRKTGDGFLDKKLSFCRDGYESIDVDRGALPIMRALEAGSIVAAAIDEPRAGGEEAELFGHTVYFPSVLFELARRTNTALLPTLCKRNADGKIEVQVSSEVGGAKEVAERFEEWIRADPSQWIIQRPVFGP